MSRVWVITILVVCVGGLVAVCVSYAIDMKRAYKDDMEAKKKTGKS